MFSARDLQRQEGPSAQPWGSQKTSVPHRPRAQEVAPSTPPLRLGRLGEGKALSASTKAALAGHWCPEHLLDTAPCCTPTLGRQCCAVSKGFCPPSALLSSARSAWHHNREGTASWTPQPREAIWGKTGVPSRSRTGKGLGCPWGQPKGRWVRSPPQTPWPQQAGRATPHPRLRSH